MAMTEDFFHFLTECPTAAHTGEAVARMLDGAGYTRLFENAPFRIVPGGKYYVTRGISSVIAFRVPEGEILSCALVASHADSPTFSVGNGRTVRANGYTRLSAEKYGGMLMATWLDRPLSVAGVISVRTETGVYQKTVKVDRDLVIIPSVAIHMNRAANENATYNPAMDMQPLFGDADAQDLLPFVAEAAGVSAEDIVSSELWLYNRALPTTVGADGAFIAGARLDDLMCAYGALRGFLAAKSAPVLPLYCLFDNEEVGSDTFGGAGSDFLASTFSRITRALGMTEEEADILRANALLLSADNAHAVHPNHPEYASPSDSCRMNGGVVVKYNANRKYTTDATSAALFLEICRRAGVPTQTYRNRADIPGGSTLGAVSNGQFSVRALDIGLAQLAMHSSYETAGARDLAFLSRATEAFYSTPLRFEGDSYILGTEKR